MNIKQRYFHVAVDSPEMQALIVLRASEIEQKKQAVALINELGAREVVVSGNHYYNQFAFDSTPCTDTFKRARGGRWTPKKGSEKGRGLIEKVKQLGLAIDLKREALRQFTLGSYPVVFTGVKAYKPFATVGIVPSDFGDIPPLVIVSLPWHDDDPDMLKKIAKYKTKSSSSGNMNLEWFSHEHNIFTHPSVTEIKPWEGQKLIDEHNEQVRKMETTYGE